jgi:HK97 gp10 family phage protein
VTFDLATTTDTADLDTIIRRLESLPAIVERYATIIADEAARLVPVKTGSLKASITVHLEALAAEITAGENLDYAAYVEYGTSRMAAQPFMRPAMERYGPAFVSAVQALLNG